MIERINMNQVIFLALFVTNQTDCWALLPKCLVFLPIKIWWFIAKLVRILLCRSLFEIIWI